MKVSQLKARTVTVPVLVPGNEGEDDTVHITFRPGALTLDLWESIKAMRENPSELDASKMFLMQPDDQLVTGWDLTNDDGTPYPCDAEHLSKLPLDFIGLIVGAIGENQLPNASRDGTSGEPSPQEALPDPSQTGSESSEQQTGSDVVPGSS